MNIYDSLLGAVHSEYECDVFLSEKLRHPILIG